MARERRRWRILHVVQLYHPVPSGAARAFAEWGERLVADGHQVTVLTTDAYDLEWLWDGRRRSVPAGDDVWRGATVARLPVRRAPGARWLYPVLRRGMAELSRLPGSTPLLRRLACLTPWQPDLPCWLAAHADAFDVVHGTNITLDFALVPLQRFAQRAGIPFLCTPFVHLGVPGDAGVVRYYTMRHQLALLRRSARVLTMTGIEQAALVARGIAPERLRRVGVGVDPAEGRAGDGARFRAQHQIHGPLILSVGALARDKGAHDLLAALAYLHAAGHADARLVMIGAPWPGFAAALDALPPAPRAAVLVLPYASDAVKYDAYAAADVFALPSRTDSFGIVYLEAWCAGLPVIGARAGGVPDVITDGSDGILVPFGDVPALAGALARLLRDPALARRMGAAGRARVLAHHTWDHVYRRVQAVYAEVLGDPAPPG